MDDIAEVAKPSSPLEELSDSDIFSQDSDDEELCSETGSGFKLQFRSIVLKACWKDDLAMAEIMNHKGNLLKSMGINRNGKIYLSIEETLFLVQIGALLLVDDNNREMPLREIHPKVAQENCGCSWEGFKVYHHLKSLGYIVGRFGIAWSVKSIRSCTMLVEDPLEKDNTAEILVAGTSFAQSMKDLRLNEECPLSEDYLSNVLKKTKSEESNFVVQLPVYEVYLPNSQFKKTSPGDPNFVVYSTSGHPPSLSHIKELERQSNGIPLKIGHVDDGRVSLFSFDKVELPALP